MVKKITKITERVFEFFCGISIAALVIVVATQVVSRQIKVSVPWAEELARFIMIWLTFIGCSLAIHRGLHLSVDFFVNLTKPKIQLLIGTLTHMIMIAFFAVLVIFGVRLSILSLHTPSSTLQWSMGLVYSILPISSLASMFFTVTDLMDYYKKNKTGGDTK